MSKGGSRYGRRSNWFKIHCLLQEQQQQAAEAAGKAGHGFGGDMSSAAAAAAVAAAQGPSLASHMGMLGYPGYLPEMMSNPDAFKNSFHSQFLSRHPDAAIAAAAAADYHQHQHQQLQHQQSSSSSAAAAAAAMPFFMMNSLPISSRSAFQLPPHLLFPGSGGPGGYHASDAYHRAEELFKHRQSVDSLSEGSNRWNESCSPEARTEELTSPAARCTPKSLTTEDIHESSPTRSMTHSPLEVNRTPEIRERETLIDAGSPISPSQTVPIDVTVSPVSPSHSHNLQPTYQQREDETSYQSKKQSESPLSVCSVVDQEQDSPMDLSMKAQSSRSASRAATAAEAVPSDNQSLISGGESDIQSESSEEEIRLAQSVARRKFYHLSENESDASSDAAESVKRHNNSANKVITMVPPVAV